MKYNSMENLAKIMRLLGDDNRLAIVISIGKESLPVTGIVQATGLSQTLVSFHLRQLRDAKIVKTRRNGPFIYYSLTERRLLDNLNELSKSANSGEGVLDNVPEVIPHKRFNRKKGQGV
jgi:DNA-binding transcriptional ArsR family regulator